MKQRVITGIIFAILFVPGIILGGIYFYCLSLIITFVSTYELMNMFYKKNEGLKIVRFIIPVFSTLFFCLLNAVCKVDTNRLMINDNKLIAQCISMSSFNVDKTSGYLYAICLFAALFIMLVISIVSIFLKNPGRSAINSMFAFLYCGVIMSLALNVEYICPIQTEGYLFKGAAFGYLYLVVCFSDMFAYFTGYLFGKHKLCPTISPKKTIEGAIGGTLMASIFGTLGAFLFKLMPITEGMSSGTIVAIVIATFVLSLLISIVSQFGDLFASVLKREYEIKDYGNILPGHGGILDRFDSTALAGAFLFVISLIIKFIVIVTM